MGYNYIIYPTLPESNSQPVPSKAHLAIILIIHPSSIMEMSEFVEFTKTVATKIAKCYMCPAYTIESLLVATCMHRP